MEKRLTIGFAGMVQGVGFRYTTLHLARQFPRITGTVRNVPDGTVELIAEGSEADLKAFADAIEDRMSAYIRRAKRSYAEPSGAFASFRIAT